MKGLCLLLVFCWSSVTAFAQHVSEVEAKEKAMAFWKQKATTSSSATRKAALQEPRLEKSSKKEGLYVFNDETNGGYVVVSGEERLPAILGYSLSGSYDEDNAPDNLKAWLDMYAGQVAYLQSHPEARAMEADTVQRDSIAPLLECFWGQREPYYNQCPSVSGQKTLTGCVATAMAQIMYYWKWPQLTLQTIPNYTTETRKIHVSSISVTSIDWDNMRPVYNSGSYTAQQADAVAKLMKLCGTALKMNYNINSSSASFRIGEVLSQYFDYDDSFEHIRRSELNASNEEWDQIVYDELAAGRPVPYDGYQFDGEKYTSGHAFVIDGYDKDGYFHVNLGWGPGSGGYFLLTAIKEYNDSQSCYIGLRPANPEEPKTYAVLNNKTLTFYHDFDFRLRQGTVYMSLKGNPWKAEKENITKAVFQPSFANVTLNSHKEFFDEYKNLKTIEGLEYLNTSASQNMAQMFYQCSALKEIDLSHFDTSNVTDMGGMFYGCSSLTSLDLSHFNTENVTDMGGLFACCYSLTSLDLSGFNTQKVKNMSYMFAECSSLENINWGDVSTENVETMAGLFAGCTSLTSLDLSGFITDSLKTTDRMFSDCSSLKSLNLSNFNTTHVTKMYEMFSNCSSLTVLDLSSFNTENVDDMYNMFDNCRSLETIYAGDGWNMENVSDHFMFIYCSKLTGGKGTRYGVDSTGADDYWSWVASYRYAHIDEGPDNPGYLTSKKEALAAYDDGLTVLQHYEEFAEGKEQLLNDSISLQQAENTIIANTILSSADSLLTVVQDFAYLTDEEKSLYNQQINAIAETVSHLKEESDSSTVLSFSNLLENAKEPIDSLRESLTVYHEFLNPVTVTGHELDSIAKAFADYVNDIQKRCLAPLDSARLTLGHTLTRLTEIVQEFAIQQELLDKLSAELNLIISDVHQVQRLDLNVKVYTLDGRQKTMTAKELNSQPKGLYILKGKKRIVK